MPLHPTLAPLQQLLEAGFPAWQIAEQARQHLAGLRQLPADTEGRSEAMDAVERFIAELPPGVPH